MSYRLPHDLAGEQQRLALMSALLDPIERVTLERLGVGPGWRCLELEVRRIDVLENQIEAGFYDFVVARALLHHLPLARNALERMVAAVKPGGASLSIEPDMLPATVAEPEPMRLFWQAWLRWSENSGIDYFIGHKMPANVGCQRSRRKQAAENSQRQEDGGLR